MVNPGLLPTCFDCSHTLLLELDPYLLG